MSVSRFSQSSIQNGFEKFNSIWDGFSAVGSMDLIQSTTVQNSSTTEIIFSNIPQTYSRLHIRGCILSNETQANDYLYFRWGRDGTYRTTSYYYHRVSSSSNSSTFQYRSQVNQGSFLMLEGEGGSLNPVSFIFDIYEYAGSKTKTALLQYAMNNNNFYGIGMTGLMNINNLNLNLLRFYRGTGLFIQGSIISLYGVK
jgi:hypothetical protein